MTTYQPITDRFDGTFAGGAEDVVAWTFANMHATPTYSEYGVYPHVQVVNRASPTSGQDIVVTVDGGPASASPTGAQHETIVPAGQEMTIPTVPVTGGTTVRLIPTSGNPSYVVQGLG